MSDDLTISSGGSVAVDADALRAVAAGLDRLGAPVGAATAHLDHVRAALLPVAFADRAVCARAIGVADEVAALAAEASLLSERLMTAAAAYDLVELRVEREAALARGADTTAIDARIARLTASHPEAIEAAAVALSARDGAEDLVPWRLLALGGMVPMLLPWLAPTARLLTAVSATGLGRVPASAAATERAAAAGPVAVQPVAPASTAVAPAGLADALGRIPADGTARVRVERYDLPDGTRAFAVYVTGTKAVFAGSEAWNGAADVRLFAGGDAPSLAATRSALTAAGAQPGDQLYAFGYSQGGMIVDALAAEGAYDTQVIVTAGSPTTFQAGEGTFSAELRHRDDPVAALADGGFAAPVGAEGGFVAERTVSAVPGVGDLTLGAHHFEQYLETAAMVDASGDPRALALAAQLAPLQAAQRVTAYEFAPAVPVPTPAPSPQAAPAPELLNAPAGGGPAGAG